MKNILRSILLCTIVLVLSTAQGRSQSILVHYWNFNSFNSAEYTDTIHAVPVDYTTITSRTASILYAEIPGTSPAYSTYLDTLTAISTDYDTINARQGAIPGIMMRARNPSDSMQLLFYIPTTNYKNIVLTYGTESSSVGSGQLHQIYDYSVDSGATWKTSGLSMSSDSAAAKVYSRASVNFFGDTLANNNNRLIFRIKFIGNNTGTSGNNRFDNVTVDADTIIVANNTSVKTFTANSSAAYTLYPNPVIDHINIISASDENKTIMVYNATGQTVYMGLEGGKQSSINTANLSKGIYYMMIRENNSGTTQTLKFVKD